MAYEDLTSADVAELGQLADTLSSVAVRGEFGAVMRCESHHELVQKLFMMVNILLDAVGTHLTEVRAGAAALEEQRALVAALSAPVIEVWEGVIMTPLVGSLDPIRVDQVLTALLERTASARARVVIIDLTGVTALAAGAAEGLARAARALALLGAETLLAGISPALAHEFVAAGVDLGGVATVRDLRQALRRALFAAR